MQDIPKITTLSYNPGSIDFEPMAGNEFTSPRRVNSIDDLTNFINQQNQEQQTKPDKKGQEMKRRIVQVFIVDPDEKMPLNESLLYQGDIELTDSTDQELFFEVEIKNILTEHNKRRCEIEDKKADSKEKKHLEPIRIRDLSMTVVKLAEF